MTQYYPALDGSGFSATRDALHSYAKLLGSWLKQFRPQRKHGWHASLRPSLSGFTTGVVHASADFELELNLRETLLQCRASSGEQFAVSLNGQSVSELNADIANFLVGIGIDVDRHLCDTVADEINSADFSVEQVRDMGLVLASISTAMHEFRAGIHEEASPIQLWPHHFDLSMIWLPGDKVANCDSQDEAYADKQLNFGFAFGDATVPRPYFYVTAYPVPEQWSTVALPADAHWQVEGFTGVILHYQDLRQQRDPHHYLLQLWNRLIDAGRQYLPDA